MQRPISPAPGDGTTSSGGLKGRERTGPGAVSLQTVCNAISEKFNLNQNEVLSTGAAAIPVVNDANVRGTMGINQRQSWSQENLVSLAEYADLPAGKRLEDM